MPTFPLVLDGQTDDLNSTPRFADIIFDSQVITWEMSTLSSDRLSDGQTLNIETIIKSADIIAEAQVLNLFGIPAPDGQGNTMYFEDTIVYDPALGQNVIKPIKIVPKLVGEYVNLPFPVNSDPWVDEFGWLFFKPSGKTIGSANSGADYARDDLKILFTRLHRNPELELLNSAGATVTKTLAENDWAQDLRLKLPYHPGCTIVSPGQNSPTDTNWQVGEVKGSNSYQPVLPEHSHDIFISDHDHVINIAPHTHQINQDPHTHTINQDPHTHSTTVHREGSNNEFGGRDFDSSDDLTFDTNPALVNLSVQPETINLTINPETVSAIVNPSSIAASSSIEGQPGDINLTPPGFCMEIFIFSGVRATPD